MALVVPCESHDHYSNRKEILADHGHATLTTNHAMPHWLPVTAPHSPTVRARRLGSYLRELRENHQLTFDAVAKRVGKHHTTIRRIEKGAHRPDPQLIEALLDMYGVGHPQRLELIDLATNAWRRGWWQQYGDVIDDTFAVLEDDAHHICTWQAQLVPGLLQTDDYARALFSKCAPLPDSDEIEQRVDARGRRRKLLQRSNSPQLHAVLGESALRQQIGGKDVMRQQLRHLLKVADQENVTIQVLSQSAGAHPGMSGSFTIFLFEHEDDPSVAYTEAASGNTYSESETALEHFRLTWSGVVDAALPSVQSVEMIATLATER